MIFKIYQRVKNKFNVDWKYKKYKKTQITEMIEPNSISGHSKILLSNIAPNFTPWNNNLEILNRIVRKIVSRQRCTLTNNFKAYPFKKYFIWMGQHDVTYEHAIYICIFVIDRFLFENVYLDMLMSIAIWNPLDLTYNVASYFKIIHTATQSFSVSSTWSNLIFLLIETRIYFRMTAQTDFKPDFELIHNFYSCFIFYHIFLQEFKQIHLMKR